MTRAVWRVGLATAMVMCAACSPTTSGSHARSSTVSAGSPSVADCAPADLHVTYRGGGSGGGSDFAVLLITNSGDQDCRFSTGHLTVNALDVHGHVLDVGPRWVNTLTLSGLRLTSHGVVSPSADPAGEWISILIGGNKRDQAGAGGECPADAEVTPAAWQLTGTLSASVPNTDVTRLAHPAPQTPAHLFACGRPTLHLLNVTIEQQP